MKYILSLFLLISFSMVQAQGVWKSTNENQLSLRQNDERGNIPKAYSTYELDFDFMKFSLKDAPHQDAENHWRNASIMELPLPDGSVESFLFVESPCMSPVLAAKFPDIKSYKGVSLDNKYNRARIDFGHNGFHGTVNTLEGKVYIEPYFLKHDAYYISYYTKDDTSHERYGMEAVSGTCGVGPADQVFSEEMKERVDNAPKYRGYEDPVRTRVYRLALACTGEWGRLKGSASVVMSEFNSAVNKCNEILGNEASIYFQLIDDNDKLIFLDPDTDRYLLNNPAGHPGRDVLGDNTDILDSEVGRDAYDVGHVFTVTCTDGIAGVARFASVCEDGAKGAGVSCVGSRNIDLFMINTTTHEFGHQFACSHSWSNCPGTMDQLAGQTAFEPGSGSTIMSYAGSCGSESIQNTNDAYYHVGSLQQLYDFAFNTLSPNCGTVEVSNNSCPVVNIPIESGFSIPISTPFELIGEAMDPDDDPMTFNWEEYDLGPTSILGNPVASAPAFRSYPPNTDPTRICPNITRILNQQTHPHEVLPRTTRNFRWRFIARDNNPDNGIASWEQVEFSANEAAGPFRVTYPSGVFNVEVGQEMEVTWDVANTDQSPVNCQFVDIYISTDGGNNFTHKVATKEPNDGSAMVRIPNDVSNLVRVKVKANDNIFFNISFPNFRIVEPTEPGFYFTLGKTEETVCLPATVEIPIEAVAFQGFSEPLNMSIISPLPTGTVATFDNDQLAPDATGVLTLDMNNVNETGVYDIVIQALVDGVDTVTQKFVLDVTASDLSDHALVSPAQNAEGIVATDFEWADSQNATSYSFELATNPSFGSAIVDQADNLTETSYSPTIVLDKNTVYYWRVFANNKCVEPSSSDVFVFATAALSCTELKSDDLPKNITASGTPTIESRIFVSDNAQVSDINVRKVKGLHSIIGQVRAFLVSPAGTEVRLWNKKCANGSNFNCGFDDESSFEIDCPLINTYIPNEPLSAFVGEDIEGDWTLRIEDTQPGGDGVFEEFELQICSNKSLNPPVLETNELLLVKRSKGAHIEESTLFTADANNASSELIYTLVDVPENGSLTKWSEVYEAGAQWTQEDLDENRIIYKNDGGAENSDQFTFTVVDGEGGFVGLTVYNIEITDSDVPTNVTDEDLDPNQFSIFPNPADDVLFIKNLNVQNDGLWKGNIYDITGKPVLDFNLQGNQALKINLENLNSGIYMLQLRQGDVVKTQSVSIVK